MVLISKISLPSSLFLIKDAVLSTTLQDIKVYDRKKNSVSTHHKILYNT